jgi:uncharacterized BrkB/YihY/UPF0761 family membrane protein
MIKPDLINKNIIKKIMKPINLHNKSINNNNNNIFYNFMIIILFIIFILFLIFRYLEKKKQSI